MNKLNRTIVIVSAVAIIAVTTIAWYLKKETNASPAGTVVRDEVLTKQLLNESIVSNGQVYFQGNDNVVATIIPKDGTEVKTVYTLAQKYASQLKSKYSDKKVNVQAVMHGANIANISK